MAFVDNYAVLVEFLTMLPYFTCILVFYISSCCEPSLQIGSRIILSYHGRRCILLPLSFPLVLFSLFPFFPHVSEGLYCIIARYCSALSPAGNYYVLVLKPSASG